MVTLAEVETIQANVLRRVYATAQSFVNLINSGAITLQQFITGQVDGAENRTKPPLIVCNYLEGAVPDSFRLDQLANFAEGQYIAYQQAGVGNPGLGPYEAIGAALGDTAGFIALIVGKTVDQLTDGFYRQAFGRAPTAQQLSHFAGQYSYFYNLYTGAGVPAATADARAKGAYLGQLLGYAGQEAGSPAANGARAWLFSAANGSPAYLSPL